VGAGSPEAAVARIRGVVVLPGSGRSAGSAGRPARHAPVAGSRPTAPMPASPMPASLALRVVAGGCWSGSGSRVGPPS